MYFLMVFLLGLAITFITIKIKSQWAKWAPSIVFFIATIFIGLKILLYPAPEMAVLGEIIYFMILGVLTMATFISGVIIHFWKRNKKS